MVGRGGAAVNAWRAARPVELCGKTLKCGVGATKGRRRYVASLRPRCASTLSILLRMRDSVPAR
jgi:hypothetical protein